MENFSDFEKDVANLRDELQQQLADIDDEYFSSWVESSEIQKSSVRNSNSFEIAEIEGEKEELLDRLDSITLRYEELEAINRTLLLEKQQLMEDNEKLIAKNSELISKARETAFGISPKASKHGDLEELYHTALSNIEKLQAEVIVLQDIKENNERDLMYQKTLRIQAEKERDAYEKAYQDSLKHFSRWTKSKMQAISSPELDMKLHTSS